MYPSGRRFKRPLYEDKAILDDDCLFGVRWPLFHVARSRRGLTIQTKRVGTSLDG